MSSRPGGNRPQCEDRRLFVILPSIDAGGSNPQNADEIFIEELIEAVTHADDARQAGWRLRAIALHRDAAGRRWLEASQRPRTECSLDTVQRSESRKAA